MFFKRLFFIIIFLTLSLFLCYSIFYPIFYSNYLSISFSSFNFIINTIIFENFKFLFLIFFIISNLIYSNLLFNKFFKNLNFESKFKHIPTTDDLYLIVSNNHDGSPIVIPSSGLYQNILITGTIRNG